MRIRLASLQNKFSLLILHLFQISRAEPETSHGIGEPQRFPAMGFRSVEPAISVRSVESAAGVWCLPSGLAVNPSWRLGRDVHVAHGPESRHHTPSAAEVLTGHFNGNSIGVSRVGVDIDYQDRERHGCRARADTDVLVASPGSQYPPRLPAIPIFTGKASESGSIQTCDHARTLPLLCRYGQHRCGYVTSLVGQCRDE